MAYPIETLGLSRRFGRVTAVNALDLRVPDCSVFGLVGPNGAGKTTTIKLLLNLIRPTAGSAAVLGKDSRRLSAADFTRIGYVSENQRLPDWMSPAALLQFCRPLYPAWDDAFCSKLATDLRLTSDAPLRTLSRGTRMKAAVLASLASRPELVVLDEPFSGLDPLARDELTHALRELSGSGRSTVFVSSHDVDELERLIDWIAFIDNGRLIFAEPVASLLKRCRLVEITGRSGSTPDAPSRPEWLIQGAVGNTLRFVDTRYDAADRQQQITAAWPDADVRVAPLSLREIFIALARHTAAS